MPVVSRPTSIVSDGEGREPRIRGCCRGVTEHICYQYYLYSCFRKDTFDLFRFPCRVIRNRRSSRSNAAVRVSSYISEERGLLALLFLTAFAREQHGELRRTCLKQPNTAYSFVSGATEVYRQHYSSLIRSTVSSTAI